MTTHRQAGTRKIRTGDRFVIGATALASMVAIAAIILLNPAGPSAAWAQATPCKSSNLHPLVDAGNVEGFRGESIWVKDACAAGRFTISAPGGATLPINAVFVSGSNPTGRLSTNFGVKPCNIPGGSDLPNAKLTVNFTNPLETETVTGTLAPDTDKPTLKTTSTPSKGTKVKAGDTIKVRMEASEEYGDARIGWQTGIKKIQLTDESRNQVVPPHFENNEPPLEIGDEQ